jgi:DNA-binding transcriptional MerR regulator
VYHLVFVHRRERRKTIVEGLTVAEAARHIGRSERWLREAERKGKIPRARRDLNGWRVYTGEDLERLKALLVPRDS